MWIQLIFNLLYIHFLCFLCTDYSIVPTGFMISVYPYFSGLLHYHCDNPMIPYKTDQNQTKSNKTTTKRKLFPQLLGCAACTVFREHDVVSYGKHSLQWRHTSGVVYQVSGKSTVYTIGYSSWWQRMHQNYTSLVGVQCVDSLHREPVIRKACPYHDVSWTS